MQLSNHTVFCVDVSYMIFILFQAFILETSDDIIKLVDFHNPYGRMATKKFEKENYKSNTKRIHGYDI